VGEGVGERSAGPAVNTPVASAPLPARRSLRSEARLGASRRRAPQQARFMDRQSKREILILAIGTLVVEVPVAAIAVIAILAH
jgi:hypothetical protein